MANDIVSRTTAAQNQISRWIEAARQRDNALVENAEDLRAALADRHTLMSAGFYTCRAIQLRCEQATPKPSQKKTTVTDTKSADLAAIPNRCPDLLKDLEYPTLRDARLVRGWPKDIRSNVAERLEEAFGPLYEGTDTWKIPLSRDARSNRSGRKSEIYKLAIALGLTWQEIDTLFLLYRQGYNPHDPLDVAFYILYHYSASHNRELAWKDIMEVLTLYQLSLRGYDPTNPTDPKNPVVQALKRCRKEKGHSLSWAEQLEVLPLFPLTSAQGGGPGTGSANTGTAVLQRMTKDLSASNAGSSGDDAFKAGLAAQMAKNAAYFDSFTISTDAVLAPEPETKSKVKTVSDVSKHKMRGQVESSARYGRSRTAALALQGLLKVLVILYPEVYTVKDVTRDHLTEEVVSFVRYPLDNAGLPSNSTDLFTAMLDRVGAPNNSTKAGLAIPDPEDALEFLRSRLIVLNDHCSKMTDVLDGRAAVRWALDHDDVLLLGWFLIRGVMSGEHADVLDAWEKALQEKRKQLVKQGDLDQMDLFSQHAGRILREIRSIQPGSDPAEQLKYTMSSYNLLLKVFSDAGLLSMSGIYLPRPMDRLVVASILYPYEQGQQRWDEEQTKTLDDEFAFVPTRDEMVLDLIHYLIDPDDPQE